MAETRVGDYLLLESIGAGALGEAFRARDAREGRTVALKLLPADFPGDPGLRARFLEEAQTASALSHPAIAALYEVGEADGRLFLASEYAMASTLRGLLAQGALHPKQAVAIVMQVADALADAHAAGITHRDIHPDSIMVTPKGGVKVLDFGLGSWTTTGRARENAVAQEDTAPQAVRDSMAYMSPEQALGQKVDAHTDIYSLGVLFYHMLTGTNPFAAPTPGATLIAILKETPKKPSEANKNVPAVLDPIVMKMLSRDVQTRYGSAAVVSSDLRDAYGERTEHILEADVPEAAGRSRRPWIAPLAAALVVAALALGGYSERREVRRIWRQWFGRPPAPSLAVIPLADVDQPASPFADALSEDLAMRLGQTAGVRVLGRSAIRHYRGRSPSQVARDTGAAAILTGTLRRDGGDLKIHMELVDPADGVQVWRQEFMAQPANVLATQAVIADEVARALRVPLSPTELHERTMSRTVSPIAYELYARARAARASGNLDAAVDLFDQAAHQDDGLAEAYAGLAEALQARASIRGGLGADLQRLRQAAARAAATEPDLGAVEIAAGLAAPSYRDALRHFVRAARHDPSSADAFQQLGDQLLHVDTARAVRMYERARSLDPGRAEAYADLVMAKTILGNTREAASEVDALLRAIPGESRAALLRARVNAGTLVAELQKSAAAGGLPPAGHEQLARRLATAGRHSDAMRVLQALHARGNGTCESHVLLAALSSTADQKLVPPSRVPAPPPDPGNLPAICAAARAAAFDDAPAAALHLQQIARDEWALRSWSGKRYGETSETAFAARLYPWSRIADAPDVAAAREEMRKALERLRRTAEEELRGMP